MKAPSSKSKKAAAPARPRSRQTRDDIVAAAARIFAEEGLAGARTDAIAAAAGVNKALLYYYFKSKEKLYEAALEDVFSDFNRQAMEVLTSPGSARAVLLRYVSIHFDFVSARHQCAPLFQQLMRSGGGFLERLIRKYFTPRGRAMDQLLERGMRDGEFRSADRFHTAISIVGLIVFYFSAAPVLRIIGRPDAYNPANLKRRKSELLDFIRHGLFVDPNFPTP